MNFEPHELDYLVTRINSRGYVVAQYPEHPAAYSGGYVRFHRLVMENMLGRYLKKGEIVHHIDKDKLNNSLNNLELLSSNAEHSVHHRTNPPTRVCPNCSSAFKVTQRVGQKYSKRKCCSEECTKALRIKKVKHKAQQRNYTKTRKPPKEVLEELVWQIPATRIGAQYGVSVNTVLNWFKSYRIVDRPGRGYWTKQRRKAAT